MAEATAVRDILALGPSRWSAGSSRKGRQRERENPHETAGKRVLCRLTSGHGCRSPAMFPLGTLGRNPHQLASKVSVPTDISGGDAVADEGPSGLNDALSVRNL